MQRKLPSASSAIASSSHVFEPADKVADDGDDDDDDSSEKLAGSDIDDSGCSDAPEWWKELGTSK